VPGTLRPAGGLGRGFNNWAQIFLGYLDSFSYQRSVTFQNGTYELGYGGFHCSIGFERYTNATAGYAGTVTNR
jgi:hypothetical protein